MQNPVTSKLSSERATTPVRRLLTGFAAIGARSRVRWTALGTRWTG
jgi:hypothetical protein